MEYHPEQPSEVPLQEAKKDKRFKLYGGAKAPRVLYVFFESDVNNKKGMYNHGRAIYELEGGVRSINISTAKLKLLFTFHEVKFEDSAKGKEAKSANDTKTLEDNKNVSVIEFFYPNKEQITEYENLLTAASNIKLGYPV